MEPTVSKIWRLQPPRIHQEVEPQPDASLDAAQPERAFQAIVVNNPGGQSVGPVMKVKRQDPCGDGSDHPVQLGADLCARRDRSPSNSPTWSVLANRGTATVVIAFQALSCFSFKREAVSPWYCLPTRRNLNPGDRDLPEDERQWHILDPSRLDNQLRDLRKLKPNQKRWCSPVLFLKPPGVKV